MKLHIGVDSHTGLAYCAAVTATDVHDKYLLVDLVHGEEHQVYGGSAYASQKALIREHAPQAEDFTHQRIRKRAKSTRLSVLVIATSHRSAPGSSMCSPS